MTSRDPLQDQDAERPTNGTLLSASLTPLIPLAPGEHGNVGETLAEFRQGLDAAIARAEGRDLEMAGDVVVAQFASVDNAAACALEIKRLIDEYNNHEQPLNRLELGIGVHIRGDEPEDGWCEGPGLRVVSALCEGAKGPWGIYFSGAARTQAKGGKGYRFEDLGELVVEGDPDPIRIFTISEAGVVSEIFEIFGHLPRIPAWIAVAGIIGLTLNFFPFGLDLAELEFDSDGIWDFFALPPPESIAILPFAEGGLRPGGQSYGDSIPARMIDDLGRYGDLEVASRRASFAFRDGSEDIVGVGNQLGVEGIVTGYTSTAGDWILVRVSVTRVSNQSQVWSRAYYERVSNIDVLQREIVKSIAKALDLDPMAASFAAARSSGLSPAALRPSDYGKLKFDLEDALKEAQRPDIDEAERIISLNNLAALYYDSGRDDEAIPVYQEVLAIHERTLGLAHPQVAVSLNNLASAYAAMGRHDEAEPLYVRSLAIREEALGPKHPRVGTALNNLASLYSRQDRLSEAEKLYERAIEIRTRELEFELSPEATQLRDVAARHELSGRYPEAQKYYNEALTVETKSKGKDSLSTASLLRSLAEVFALGGDQEEAKSFFDRALELMSLRLGSKHPEVGRTMGDLGELHRQSGRMVEAEKFHENSLEALEYSLGPDHPEVAGTLSNLASIFEAQGRDKEAEAARKREQAIHGIYLGPVFSYVAARSSGQYVVRDRVRDELNVAQPSHEYLVTIEEGELVDEKRRFAESLHGLALLQLKQGRYAQAERNNLRSLEIWEALTGREHPQVAISLHSLARLYTLQGRLDEAYRYYQDARRIFESTVGRMHPHVARCWEDLAEMLRIADRFEEAEDADQRATEIRTALTPRDNPAG